MPLGTSGHIGGTGDSWPGLEAPDIVCDAPRPATILRVADALESQGGHVLELFREVESLAGRAVFPIHLTRSGSEFFIEVETGRWTQQVIKSVVRRVAVLRASEDGAEKGVLILSSYPIPEAPSFFTGTSRNALLQLPLANLDLEDPKLASGDFLDSFHRHWTGDIDYGTQYLPLVEEMISELKAGPVLDEFVWSLGAYLGETIRLAVMENGITALWSRGERTREVLLITEDFELDPIGKAREFVENGEQDSIAFYAGYVLEEISASSGR